MAGLYTTQQTISYRCIRAARG